ncbi:unnamed protein product [Calypogeia fissa]
MGYLLYDHGDSRWFTYFKVVEVLGIVCAVLLGRNELKFGHGLAYSKFTSESRKEIRQVSSRVGMLIIYTPAALIGACYLLGNVIANRVWDGNIGSSNVGTIKVLILSAALFLHYLKRDLETLFLHHYSGKTGFRSALTLSLIYFVTVANMNLVQQKSKDFAPPALDLTRVGIGFFIIGVLGNLYHHILLRGLRKGGDTKYVIPEGGLFGVFVAPHYIFEIVTFLGVTLISQTYLAVSTLVIVVIYLGCRSYSTKQWYLKKIDRFPKNRCAMVPYVF